MKRIYIITISMLMLALPVAAFAQGNRLDIYHPEENAAMVEGDEYKVRFDLEGEDLQSVSAVFTRPNTLEHLAAGQATEVKHAKNRLDDGYSYSLGVKASAEYGVNGSGQYWLWVFSRSEAGSASAYIPVNMVARAKAEKDGWYTRDGDRYYGKDGYTLTGWQQPDTGEVNPKRYYFDQKGIMQTGWITDDNKWYHLQTDGSMATGWLESNNDKYFLDTMEGYMYTNWRFIQNDWYFFHPDNGKVQTGWLEVDGRKYYMDDEGRMLLGWQKMDTNGGERMFYFRPPEGDLFGGLRLVDGTIYFAFPNGGDLLTGWQQLGDKWHYLLEDGGVATGWHKLGNASYFFDGDGEMQTGWLEHEGSRYYLKPISGAMMTGMQTIDGEKYTFDDSGKLID